MLLTTSDALWLAKKTWRKSQLLHKCCQVPGEQWQLARHILSLASMEHREPAESGMRGILAVGARRAIMLCSAEACLAEVSVLLEEAAPAIICLMYTEEPAGRLAEPFLVLEQVNAPSGGAATASHVCRVCAARLHGCPLLQPRSGKSGALPSNLCC